MIFFWQSDFSASNEILSTSFEVRPLQNGFSPVWSYLRTPEVNGILILAEENT